MAAPNLNSTSLTVKPAVDTLMPANTTETALTSNSAASGHTYITLSLTCANNTSSAVTARVNWYDGTNDRRIAYDISVPGFSTLEACPTRKMLLEGWTIKVKSGTASAIEYTHHYLDCS